MAQESHFGGGAFHFFAKGDFKGLILHVLEEKPMHGYEIMKALEDRFQGFYKPSPGAIYPALQALRRRRFVSAKGDERRKVYQITATGRAFLRHRRAEIEDRMMAFESAVGPERAALFRELRQTGKVLGTNIRHVTPAQAKRLRAVIVHTRKQILNIIGE